MSEKAATRVLLAEDHRVVREGIRALLAQSSDLTVVGEAEDGPSAVEQALALEPHVVVMDVSLPRLGGIEATQAIRRQLPEVEVVVLSMHDDASTVDRALRAGARGYVLKGEGVDGLTDAIRSVAEGRAWLSSGISDYVLQGYLNASGGSEVDPLTAREREVLQLIAEGFTSREIAEQIGLKTKTVQNHRTHIMAKLDIHTTAGLVRYALRRGIAR